MDLAIWLALAGLGVAGYTAIPTTLAWVEAARQRRHAEKIAQVTPASSPAAARREWVVGIYDYAPLSAIEDSREWAATGPLVLMAKHLAACSGRTLKLKKFAYEDFYNPDTEIPDLIMGMFETPRRAQFVTFSRPIYEIGLQGICRIDADDDILEGLRERRLKVAVYSGEVGWEFIKDELPEAIDEHRVASLLGGHQMHTMTFLTAGIYDAVLMDHLSCVIFLNEGENRLKFKLAFPAPIKMYGIGVAANKANEDLLSDINRLLIEFRNSDEYQHAEAQVLVGMENVVHRRGLRKTRA